VLSISRDDARALWRDLDADFKLLASETRLQVTTFLGQSLPAYVQHFDAGTVEGGFTGWLRAPASAGVAEVTRILAGKQMRLYGRFAPDALRDAFALLGAGALAEEEKLPGRIEKVHRIGAGSARPPAFLAWHVFDRAADALGCEGDWAFVDRCAGLASELHAKLRPHAQVATEISDCALAGALRPAWERWAALSWPELDQAFAVFL